MVAVDTLGRDEPLATKATEENERLIGQVNSTMIFALLEMFELDVANFTLERSMAEFVVDFARHSRVKHTRALKTQY